MLLTESEKAKQIRACIFDIVISTINKREGSHAYCQGPLFQRWQQTHCVHAIPVVSQRQHLINKNN